MEGRDHPFLDPDRPFLLVLDRPSLEGGSLAGVWRSRDLRDHHRPLVVRPTVEVRPIPQDYAAAGAVVVVVVAAAVGQGERWCPIDSESSLVGQKLEMLNWILGLS